MKIVLAGTKVADLNLGRTALVLDQGPNAYCSLRAGNSVDLVADDGTVSAVVNTVVLGPLCTHFSGTQYGLPQHYAVKQINGQPGDVRDMVDALERQYPKEKTKAVDPRTIYSALQVQLPYPQAIAAA